MIEYIQSKIKEIQTTLNINIELEDRIRDGLIEYLSQLKETESKLCQLDKTY